MLAHRDHDTVAMGDEGLDKHPENIIHKAKGVENTSDLQAGQLHGWQWPEAGTGRLQSQTPNLDVGESELPQDKQQQADAHCVLQDPGPAAASESNPQAGHGCCACRCQSCITVTMVKSDQGGGSA